jgi:hypothetical protein
VSVGRVALWTLWPAFLVAGVAEFVFFSLFDPHELHLFGQPLDASRQAIYTIGFFCFWLVGAASAALALFLKSSADDRDR